MRGIGCWSGRRIAALWAVWLAAVVALPVLAFGVAVWRADGDLTPAPDPAALPVRGGDSGRLAFLPAQHTDFVFHVAWPDALLLALLALGPPALLTLAWRAARRRDPDRPT